MFTKDTYGTHIKPNAMESDLTAIGKKCSWIVVFALAALAIVLKDQASLISLIDRKFDLLVQLVPGFMIGIHWKQLRSGPTLAGLVSGLAIALALAFGPFDFVVAGKVWGIHPGLYGLAINLAIAVGGSILITRLELSENPLRAPGTAS
jgi:SSS family solute:Na+ symporter/sodium/pantothenate symporter